MFADPAVITPTGGSAQSLVKVNQDGYSSEYSKRTATDDWQLLIRNSTYTKKNGKVTDRHNVLLTHTVFPVAPATIGTIRKVSFVFENEQGDTVADPVAEAAGLLAFLTASTNANLTKLTGRES